MLACSTELQIHDAMDIVEVIRLAWRQSQQTSRKCAACICSRMESEDNITDHTFNISQQPDITSKPGPNQVELHTKGTAVT